MRHENHFDAISPATQNLRKLGGFFTYRSERKKNAARATPANLKEQIGEIHARAQARELTSRHKLIWTLESLGSSYVNPPGGAHTLDIPDLDPTVVPILHVGAGLSIVENVGFDAQRIREAISAVAQPAYRDFPFETMGAMLAHYSDAPKAAIWMLGLKNVKPPANRSSYVGQFEKEIRRVLSHGYGRILYFSRLTLASAVGDAFDRPYLDRDAAVQGIAFAYTIVNAPDLSKVLQTASNLKSMLAGSAFVDGVIYALAAMEWTLPGYLDEVVWRQRTNGQSEQRQIIETAQRNVREFRRMGRVPPFQLVTRPTGDRAPE